MKAMLGVLQLPSGSHLADSGGCRPLKDVERFDGRFGGRGPHVDLDVGLLLVSGDVVLPGRPLGHRALRKGAGAALPTRVRRSGKPALPCLNPPSGTPAGWGRQADGQGVESGQRGDWGTKSGVTRYVSGE